MVKGGWQTIKAFFTSEWTFGELLSSTLAMLLDLAGALKNIAGFLGGLLMKPLKAIVGLVGAGLKAGLEGAIALGRTAVQTIGNLLQRVLDIEGIAKGFKAMGGIAGVLLGPLGPLLKLFSPLIDMVVRQFTPAIETFAAIIENAFGPFAMTLEIIARNLATQLVPLIGPFASMLEIIAVQIGVFISSLLKGKPDKLFAAVFLAFRQAQPIIMQVLQTLMDVGTEALMDIFKMMVQLAPVLIKTFAEFLKAVLPLIPVLTKLGLELLQKVFLPATISILQFITKWLPPIAYIIENDVVPWIQWITDSVSDFYGNLGKYGTDFYILFIEPIVKSFTDAYNVVMGFFKSLWKKITEFVTYVTTAGVNIINALGLGDIGSRAAGVINSIMNALRSPLETMKGIINDNVIDTANSILSWDPPGPGGRLSNIIGLGRRYQIPRLAAGGIVDGETEAIIGEAGREMVLPLKRDVIRDVLTPLMPDLEFPALDQLVRLAGLIERQLSTGTVRVDAGLESLTLGGGESGGDELANTVGMMGVGAW